MQPLTVVIINCHRPANVKQLLRHYSKMPEHLVQQVLVADCAHAMDQQIEVMRFGGRETLIMCTPDPGLAVRFAAAGLSRTKHVLLADDDLTLPASSLETLSAMAQGENCQTGLFGRQPGPDGGYEPKEHYGPSEIILTRATVVTREACCLALSATQDMADALGGIPRGNGEDIVLSYVAAKLNNKLGIATHEKYIAFPKDTHGICRHPDHRSHRSNVVRWCRHRFAGQLYP